MSLKEKIQELLKLYNAGIHAECVFVLPTAVNYSDAKIIIDKSNLIDFDLFEIEFHRLLDKGFSWINLNVTGIWKNKLVITVELPLNRSAVPKESVSINLSGPSGQRLEVI